MGRNSASDLLCAHTLNLYELYFKLMLSNIVRAQKSGPVITNNSFYCSSHSYNLHASFAVLLLPFLFVSRKQSHNSVPCLHTNSFVLMLHFLTASFLASLFASIFCSLPSCLLSFCFGSSLITSKRGILACFAAFLTAYILGKGLLDFLPTDFPELLLFASLLSCFSRHQLVAIF